MKNLKHSAIALIAGGLAFANIATAADLDGTVFAPNQYRYQNMSQAERDLANQMNGQQGNRNQYRNQNANGSGDRSRTRTRTRSQSHYGDSPAGSSGYGSGYGNRQGGGRGRGRH
jgi:hypothetical protein